MLTNEENEYLCRVGSGTPSVLGMMGLALGDRGGEIGFVVARAAWGKGYATEALRAVLDAALATPELHRV
ncbi:MAG: GNAT family N-acetyltransferase [Chloroflexi bacterium]|nr:GNAT family N-acetyltransferase [Chloroflexota bacterium]